MIMIMIMVAFLLANVNQDFAIENPIFLFH